MIFYLQPRNQAPIHALEYPKSQRQKTWMNIKIRSHDMLIVLFDIQEIIHTYWVLKGQILNKIYYQVLTTLH